MSLQPRVLFSTILIICLCRSAQGRDVYLYNERGQFYLDTTLSISQNQFEVWKRAEFNIIGYLSGVEYPPIYLENGIEPAGIVIASFECDSDVISDIKILNDTSEFANSVKRKINEVRVRIINELKLHSKLNGHNYTGKYYLAFNFLMIDFYKELTKSKSIPIIRGSVPLLDRMID